MLLKKKKHRRRFLTFLGIGSVALCLIIFIAVLSVQIYRDAQFKKNLPDPLAAPTMYQLSIARGTYFYNMAGYKSVLIPDADFTIMDIGSLKNQMQLDVLIVKEDNQLYVNMLEGICNFPIGTIFIPSGMKKENKLHIAGLFPNSTIIEADKEGCAIVGDYVFYFYGNKHSINTLVQYGTSTFFIADFVQKKKVACDVAIMPYQAFLDSKVTAEYVIFDKDSVVSKEAIVDKVMYYAVDPGVNYFSLSMHNFENRDKVIFDIQFDATGKLKEQN